MCRAYNVGEVLADKQALEDARKFAKRLYEVAFNFKATLFSDNQDF